MGEFSRELVKRAEGLRLGDGLAAGTTPGPLANSRRLGAMAKVMEDARSKGATIATRGERVGTGGNFFAPTVITDVSPDADVFNNEPFCTVAAVRAFGTLDEAIAEGNRLPFGGTGAAFTHSIKTAHALTQRLELGMLWINQPATPSAEMPVGGVQDSGHGSEGGPEALDADLVTKAVSILGV